MKTHTEIVWHYEGNPPEDGKYLVAYGMSEIYYITTDDYTVKYGWGTCPFLEMEIKGQHPEDMRAWAEFPF